MPISNNPQLTARQSGARILRYPDSQDATQDDFGKPLSVLFVHGFTANANYMQKLMHQFSGSGFHTLAFEYPTDRGIHQAAMVLRERLENYNHEQAISNNRIVLVCHSMGGLVARALIAFEGGERYVRKVITLGTPHDGTLENAKLLRFLLNWGEYIGGLNPYAFSPNSTSAMELTKNDGPRPLLSRMLNSNTKASDVEFLSISGGLAQLEFGLNPVKNKLANVYVQENLSIPNDGLVAEMSSDLSGEIFRKCAPGCQHVNSYIEYPYTNHTYLVANQVVAMKAVTFARLDSRMHKMGFVAPPDLPTGDRAVT